MRFEDRWIRRVIQVVLIGLLAMTGLVGTPQAASTAPTTTNITDSCTSPSDPPDSCTGPSHRSAEIVVTTTSQGGRFDCSIDGHVVASPGGWWSWGGSSCVPSFATQTMSHLGLSLIYESPTHVESWNGCWGCQNVTHEHELDCSNCEVQEIAQMRNQHLLTFPTTVTSWSISIQSEGANETDPLCNVEGVDSLRCFTKPSAVREAEPSNKTQVVMVDTVDGTFQCSFDAHVVPTPRGWNADGSTDCTSWTPEPVTPTQLGVTLKYTSPSYLEESKGCGEAFVGSQGPVTQPECNNEDGFSPAPGTFRASHVLEMLCTQCDVTQTAQMDNRHIMGFPSTITAWSRNENCDRVSNDIICYTAPNATRGPSQTYVKQMVTGTTVAGDTFECYFDSQVTPEEYGWWATGSTTCDSTVQPTHLGLTLRYTAPLPEHEGWAGCGTVEYQGQTLTATACFGFGESYGVSHQLRKSCGGSSCLEPQTAVMENRHLIVLPTSILDDWTGPRNCERVPGYLDRILCFSRPSATKPPSPPPPPVSISRAFRVTLEGGAILTCYFEFAGGHGKGIGKMGCYSPERKRPGLIMQMRFVDLTPESGETHGAEENSLTCGGSDSWPPPLPNSSSDLYECRHYEDPPGSGHFQVTAVWLTTGCFGICVPNHYFRFSFFPEAIIACTGCGTMATNCVKGSTGVFCTSWPYVTQ